MRLADRALTLVPALVLASLLLAPTAAWSDDAPTDDAPTETPAQARKAERKAKRLATLHAAIDDYESKYKGWHLNPGARWFHARLSAELGFVGILSHEIQFGRDGTNIDYLVDGGQNNLFLFARLSADFEFAHHLVVTFLYQPLNLKTNSVFQRDIRFEGTTFPAGTPMSLRYGFDFYRLSIGGDFLPHPEREFLLGFSAQIRNATVDFTSADGTLGTTNRDIGFVPILKARFRWTFDANWLIGAEVDGWFASGRGVSGSTNDFDAAFIDASIRWGMVFRPIGDVFLNLRYIGGGSVGTDETPEPPGDGYGRNWIHALTLSLGVQVR